MNTPQVLMIIYLTLSFVILILRGVYEKTALGGFIVATIKVIFLSTVLYYGGFWN